MAGAKHGHFPPVAQSRFESEGDSLNHMGDGNRRRGASAGMHSSHR